LEPQRLVAVHQSQASVSEVQDQLLPRLLEVHQLHPLAVQIKIHQLLERRLHLLLSLRNKLQEFLLSVVEELLHSRLEQQ